MLRNFKIILLTLIVTFYSISEISSNPTSQNDIVKRAPQAPTATTGMAGEVMPVMAAQPPADGMPVLDLSKAATVTLPNDDIVKHITGVPTMKPTDSQAVLFNLPVPGAAVEEHLKGRSNTLVASKSFIVTGFIILILCQFIFI